MSSRLVQQQILSETTIAKLEEMAKQRKELETHYSKVLSDADATDSEVEKFWILRDGILHVHTHHQHVRDTTLVRDQMEIPGFYGSEGIKRWSRKLRKEVESGKKRQSQTKLFGSVLEEWLKGSSQEPIDPSGEDILMSDFEEIESGKKEEDSPLEKPFIAYPGKIDSNVIDRVWDMFGPHNTPMTNSIHDIELRMTQTVTKGETKAAIGNIVKKGLIWDKNVIEGLLGVLKDDITITELANLLTIRVNDFENWDWPRDISQKSSSSSFLSSSSASPPLLRFQKFSNGKWRAFLDADFMNILLLQVIGTRWSVEIRRCLLACQPTQKSTSSTLYNDFADRASLFLSSLPTSLEEESKDSYQTTEEEEEDLDDTPATDGFDKRLASFHYMATHLAYAKQFQPWKGMVVAFVDIQDFSNSIPHEAILEILKKMGVSHKWIKFFERFMKPSVQIKGREGALRVVQRGLPLRYQLSFLFSELILYFADFEMDKVNRDGKLKLGLTRTMDDYYFWSSNPKIVADAYTSLKNVLGCFGMKVNEEKSGHCSISFPVEMNGMRRLYEMRETSVKKGLPSPIIDPKSMKLLPKGDVTWGFLKLDKDGIWRVQNQKLEEFKKSMFEKVTAAPSLMAQVNIYNSQLSLLAMYLGEPHQALGIENLNSIMEAYQSIHHRFDGEKSALEHFVGEIKKRFLMEDNYEVPEAWLYWPVTAGGLGLKHPLVLLFGMKSAHPSNLTWYHESCYSVPPEWNPTTRANLTPAERKRKTNQNGLGYVTWTPEEEIERKWTWLTEQGKDPNLVLGLASPYTVLEPPSSAEFSKLLGMFCERGTSMREKTQTNLSPYWKWIVFNYSDQILEDFGSLEFASAGAIPLHLILSIKKESH